MKTTTNYDNVVEAAQKCFDEYLKSGFVPSGKYVFFDLLRHYKILHASGDQIRTAYNDAQSFLLFEEKKKPHGQQKLYLYEGGKRLCVVFKAKAMLLEHFFSILKLNNQNLKQFINSKTVTK